MEELGMHAGATREGTRCQILFPCYTVGSNKKIRIQKTDGCLVDVGVQTVSGSRLFEVVFVFFEVVFL